MWVWNSGTGSEAGMGPDPRGWRGIGGGLFSSTMITDHRGAHNEVSWKDVKCERQEAVDESCVEEQINPSRFGESLGPWIPVANDCDSFAMSVVSKCHPNYSTWLVQCMYGMLVMRMDSASKLRLSGSRVWRIQPAVCLCILLLCVVLTSLAVGMGARVTYVGRWMSGVCGEWAPPGWRNDPRCDGSLYPLERCAYRTAKWSGGGLAAGCVWLIVRRARHRAEKRGEGGRGDGGSH